MTNLIKIQKREPFIESLLFKQLKKQIINKLTKTQM